MRKMIIAIIASVAFLLLIGCMNMMDASEEASVFPMYIDDNGNGINDYVEKTTHFSGADGPALSKRRGETATYPDGHDFTDENGDGICDYWESGNMMHNRNNGMRFIDENHNAINDYVERSTHNGGGHDFIDENGDGICDFAQDGSSSWHGPGYTDTDHNGVCDAWQPGHMGYGGMMHHN